MLVCARGNKKQNNISKWQPATLFQPLPLLHHNPICFAELESTWNTPKWNCWQMEECGYGESLRFKPHLLCPQVSPREASPPLPPLLTPTATTFPWPWSFLTTDSRWQGNWKLAIYNRISSVDAPVSVPFLSPEGLEHLHQVSCCKQLIHGLCVTYRSAVGAQSKHKTSGSTVYSRMPATDAPATSGHMIHKDQVMQ